MHNNMSHVHVHVLHVHVGIWLPRARPPPRNLALSTCDTPPPNARQCTIHSHLPPHAATHRSSTRSFSAAKARASPRWREGASVGEPFANPAPAASRRLSRRCFQTRAAAAPTARWARSSPAGEEGEAPSSARSASARKRSRASCIARGPSTVGVEHEATREEPPPPTAPRASPLGGEADGGGVVRQRHSRLAEPAQPLLRVRVRLAESEQKGLLVDQEGVVRVAGLDEAVVLEQLVVGAVAV